MACLLCLVACGGQKRLPLDTLRAAMQGVPTYSIVLDDMKEEGNFLKTYYHKYRIITEDGISHTDWKEVPKSFFQDYLPFLGMTIWVKEDGQEKSQVGPPGYEYVGNPRYGSWHRDHSGNSFWVFYGQYRLMSDLLGPGPIYRSHYNDYSRYTSQGRAYYGDKKQYGTNGSFTQRQKPNFYSRKMSALQSGRVSFSDRVKSRVGRTRTSMRSRSTRVGK